MSREDLMREALRLARENVAAGGGPFAALVVKDGAVLAAATNRVVPDRDPTAHAEVLAIREACRKLDAFRLDGCEIYASCEPCPMCAGAIAWARPARVFYAATRDDAARAGFDDARMWREIASAPRDRTVPAERLLGEEAADPFAAWSANASRTRY